MKWAITFAVLNLVALLALLPLRWLADSAVTARMATNGIRAMEQTRLLRIEEADDFNRQFPDVNVNNRNDLVHFLSDHKDTYEHLIVDPVSILLLLNTVVFFALAGMIKQGSRQQHARQVSSEAALSVPPD